ncbi:MAG: hypothetical protein ACRD88_04740, partial [Terriglobia bacterium]
YTGSPPPHSNEPLMKIGVVVFPGSEEALWLDRARVARYGRASDVIREYEAAMPRAGGGL